MFSGIIEATGKVVKIEKKDSNINFTITCPFVKELKIDQSVAHNGVCLTVVEKLIEKGEESYTVTAIHETLIKSNLGTVNEGDLINLERSMMLNERLDGHIVQGHVDTIAVCESVEACDGSWYYKFLYKQAPGHITVEKGSITVNGVSLTVVDSQKDSFKVAIIPYTYEHTNFHCFKKGSVVNLEFDIIGKYVARLMNV